MDVSQLGSCLLYTSVIPARLIGEKESSGGRVEFLLLKRDGELWETLVKPGKRAKIGSRISFGGGKLVAEVVDIVEDGSRMVKFIYDGIFEEVLDELGNMPLPPYITAKLDDKERYQTVYSKHKGSAAAPTAGPVSYTQDVYKRQERRG